MAITRSFEDRFWPKVIRADGDACWIWNAVKNNRGYGMHGRGGKYGVPVLAHRASWEIHHGPIPPGLQVLHKCDVKACVRPDHLFLGTAMDNMADKIAKGRQKCKLTKEQVIAIRQDTGILKEIAAKHNITLQNAHYIRSGATWRWLS